MQYNQRLNADRNFCSVDLPAGRQVYNFWREVFVWHFVQGVLT
jgi:hypothetical protein